MKKYIQEIFPRLVKFSKTIDDLTILVDRTWIVASADTSERKLFIFRTNGDLIVSTTGEVELGK